MTKNKWTLVHNDTKAPAQVGEIVKSFRGDEQTLLGGTPPHKPSSSGKVWVENAEYYPEVFNLKWVEINAVRD